MFGPDGCGFKKKQYKSQQNFKDIIIIIYSDYLHIHPSLRYQPRFTNLWFGATRFNNMYNEERTKCIIYKAYVHVRLY